MPSIKQFIKKIFFIPRSDIYFFIKKEKYLMSKHQI